MGGEPRRQAATIQPCGNPSLPSQQNPTLSSQPSPKASYLPDLARFVPLTMPRLFEEVSKSLCFLFSQVTRQLFDFSPAYSSLQYNRRPSQEKLKEPDHFITQPASSSGCSPVACSFQNPLAEASCACKQCCCVTHMQLPAMLCNGRWQKRKETEKANEAA